MKKTGSHLLYFISIGKSCNH